MSARRKVLDALLEREALRPSTAASAADGTPRHLNAVWRQKVITWYFTLVAALGRQHAESNGDVNPFDRSAVHVTASMLDNYLTSLPSERAMRYKHDRPAYQLLATTCLLLGLRLARHDKAKEESRQEEQAAAEKPSCGLKRAKAHMMNMSEVPTTEPQVDGGVAIPNASTILRISAAPKSLTERHVASMVKEVTSSRSFPRSKVVTALDFIAALSGASTEFGQDGITLGPFEAEEASRLADAALRETSFIGSSPSVVASAAISLALARSERVNMTLASIRQQVLRSVYGPEINSALHASSLKAESNLLVSIQARVPSPRNGVRRMVPTVPTTHLIPDD